MSELYRSEAIPCRAGAEGEGEMMMPSPQQRTEAEGASVEDVGQEESKRG